TITPDKSSLTDERVFALLHRDRVDDALALQALEPGLDHLPLGGVEHEGHLRYGGLGGGEGQELLHRRLGVEHALVEVDVDDHRTGFDLLARDLERGVVIVREDELLELRGAGDVRALADVHEIRFGPDRERFEPGEAKTLRYVGDRARRDSSDGARDGGDVRGRGAAAAADDVE